MTGVDRNLSRHPVGHAKKKKKKKKKKGAQKKKKKIGAQKQIARPIETQLQSVTKYLRLTLVFM